MEGKVPVKMMMLVAVWWRLTVPAAAAQTGQIVFQEDRGSRILKYILSIVPLGWRCVFPALTALLCVFFAVWMAKNRKKRKQS